MSLLTDFWIENELWGFKDTSSNAVMKAISRPVSAEETIFFSKWKLPFLVMKRKAFI